MSARRSTRRSRSLRWPVAGLAVAALAAIGLLVADATTAEPRSDEAGALVEVPEVDRGVRYCPVTAGEGEEATLVLATGPEGSEATVVRYGEQGPEEDEPQELGPHERVEVPLDGAAARRPVAVEWLGGPLAVSWHVDGDRDAGAPCPTGPADRWHLAALDTALGAQARLHLFNPFSADAVVRVRFGTPDGRVDLVSTDNVVVPAGGTEVLDLVEVQPEQPELGVTVETLAGRVVAAGEVDRTRLDEDDEGPQGRTVVPAAAEPAGEWHLPSTIVGEGWQSDVVVYNPGEREAAVTVRTSDPRGDAAHGEHAVAPGATTRIGLGGLSEASAFAAVVETVTDVPVVVAHTEGFLDPERPGFTVQAPAVSPGSTWVVPGAPGERDELVAIHNPGGEEVSVQLSVSGGSVDGWDDRVLAPNERAVLPSEELGGADGPVFVDADGAVSVALVSNLAAGGDFGRLLGLAFDVTDEAPGGAGVDGPVRLRYDPSLGTEPVRPPEAGDEAQEEDLELPDLEEPEEDDPGDGVES